jgi:hypothetical protein
MNSKRLCLGLLSALLLGFSLQDATAAVAIVDEFGDSGWTSLDTRNAAGTNIVLPADYAAISAQMGFELDPLTGTGALRLATSTNNSKASLGVNGTFGAAAQLAMGFSASYTWMTTGPSFRTSPLKIGIQSTSYVAPLTPTSRTNEDQWDYILVHDTTNIGAQNVWKTESITSTSGNWVIYRSGAIGGGQVLVPSGTLDSLANSADPTLQSIFNGSIVSIEFGLGSSQGGATNYVDSFQTSIYNNGDLVDFQAPVPEPATLAIWSAFVGCVFFAGWKRRRVGI